MIPLWCSVAAVAVESIQKDFCRGCHTDHSEHLAYDPKQSLADLQLPKEPGEESEWPALPDRHVAQTFEELIGNKLIGQSY